MNFETLNLYVADMEKTVQFYSNLGFKFTDDAKNKSYNKITLNCTNIAFYTMSSVNQFFTSPSLHPSDGNQFNLSLRVENSEDINRIFDKMNKMNFFPFKGPLNADWNQRVLFYKDPDGNLIEICAHLI